MRLTSKVIEEVSEAILHGVPVRFACAKSGIAKTSYYRWRARGLLVLEALDDGKEPATTDDDAYLRFYLETEKAHGDYVQRCSLHVQEAMKNAWQAACWSLERRYPDEYGRFGIPLGELNEATTDESVRKTENNTPTESEVKAAGIRLMENVGDPA